MPQSQAPWTAPTIDAAAVASKLPRPLQWPAGAAIEGLKQLTGMGSGDPNQVMGVATTAPVMPKSDALAGLVRQYSGPVQETLGEIHPDFTPMGGEGLYNVAKGGVRKAGDAVDAAYQSLMSKLGGLGR